MSYARARGTAAHVFAVLLEGGSEGLAINGSLGAKMLNESHGFAMRSFLYTRPRGKEVQIIPSPQRTLKFRSIPERLMGPLKRLRARYHPWSRPPGRMGSGPVVSAYPGIHLCANAGMFIVCAIGRPLPGW